MLASPFDLRDGIVRRIRREAEHARAGQPARLIAKMNGLEDPVVIEELYGREPGQASESDLDRPRPVLSASRHPWSVRPYPGDLDYRPLP